MKSYRHLRPEERAVIATLKQQGKTQVEIATELGRHRSTISRELKRNSTKKSYNYQKAQKKSNHRKAQKKPRGRAINESNQSLIEAAIRKQWSPEQISGTLRKNGQRVSHQSIYKHIYHDRQQRGDLYRNLRINGKRRYRRKAGYKRHKIPHRIDIDERPEVVETRQRAGDWEVDLICGTRGGGYLLSLCERKTRYALLMLLEVKTAEQCSQAIIEQLKGHKVHTLTFDNGPEFSGHQSVTQALNAKGYFCKPYHSWEKGSVENYNGLVRQYLPPGTDFIEHGAELISWVEKQINQRPRKCLDYSTPEEEYKKENKANHRQDQSVLH